MNAISRRQVKDFNNNQLDTLFDVWRNHQAQVTVKSSACNNECQKDVNRRYTGEKNTLYTLSLIHI